MAGPAYVSKSPPLSLGENPWAIQTRLTDVSFSGQPIFLLFPRFQGVQLFTEGRGFQYCDFPGRSRLPAPHPLTPPPHTSGSANANE